MADGLPGASAPVENAPAAQAVPTPDVPVVGNVEGLEPAKEPVQPRTYSEDEHRKGISERLAKERRRLERAVRAEVERDHYKQQLESRQQPQERKQAEGAPKPEDFGGNYEKYLIAAAKYELKQDLEQERQRSHQETSTQQRARENTERSQFIRENLVSKGQEKYEDFDDVVMADDLAITEPMAAAIARLPAGYDVWYHLGQNPKEAKRIASLPDVEQVWEIKALESKLSAPPKPSQAPAPIVPNGTQAAGRKDWKDMSTAEHIKAYHNRNRKR